ncbi:hypothetical protein N9A67_03025 [Rhodobacteraceae bacterium]|nr:hypothetical protein [Paracoccaceae bacterium]
MTKLIQSLTSFGIACAVQPWVAQDPVVHVLVQMPLLVLAGVLWPLPHVKLPQDLIGPILILWLVTLIMWMMPRSVDAALTQWVGHFAKFVTLPILLGLPLRLTWPSIGPLFRGFLRAQAISMLLLLSFLYTHAPVRICNSYLVSDQYRLGLGFAWVAGALVIIWLIPVFTGHTLSHRKGVTDDLC